MFRETLGLAIVTLVIGGSVWQTAPAAAASASQSVVAVQRNIPYVKPPRGQVDRQQTLDLYLPKITASVRPPLLVFIHGGFWRESDDNYGLGKSVAEALVKNGVAVALVRYRLAPAYRHPAQAEDIAAALSYLMRETNSYGYDLKRIYVAGHSAGGHLAALVALDRAYLKEQGLQPELLAGVIGISGMFDLAPAVRVSEMQKAAAILNFGESLTTRRAASPLAHVRSQAPPFLILSAAADFPGLQIDARKFADALRRSGHKNVDQFVLPEHDHFSIVKLNGKDHETTALILDFMKEQPLAGDFGALADAKRRWVNPPFSTEPFWRYEKLVRSYPIDARFVQALAAIYGHTKYELLAWPLEEFHAIDLFAYLETLPSDRIGRGDHLVTTNIRNEKQFWKRQESEPYRPVIVIGIDEERNLFRLGAFSQAFREYSWRPSPRPPLMARPLGAFVYFLKEPPRPLWPHPAQYALKEDSFKLMSEDPLGPLRSLPQGAYETLTFRNGCVYCHTFRGIGSKSHHTLASTGAAHGGYGLPLEAYPPPVWKEFIFNQIDTAKKIGVSPNLVDERDRQAMYDLIAESRKAGPVNR
jgi:acetyl esterase/lipase